MPVKDGVPKPGPQLPRGSILFDLEEKEMVFQPASASKQRPEGQSNHGLRLPVPTGPGPYKGTRAFNFAAIRNEHVSVAAELISLFKIFSY